MLHSGFERGTDLIDGERYDPILVVAPDRRVYKGATRSQHLNALTGSGGKGGDDLTVFRLGHRNTVGPLPAPAVDSITSQ